MQAIPPTGLGLLMDQWTVENSESAADYVFPSPLRVSGVIKELGNPLAPSLPAQIVGESDGLIPGTMLGMDARAIEGVNEDFEAFEMQVIPNRPYRVYVFPDDEDRPPKWRRSYLGKMKPIISSVYRQKRGRLPTQK